MFPGNDVGQASTCMINHELKCALPSLSLPLQRATQRHQHVHAACYRRADKRFFERSVYARRAAAVPGSIDRFVWWDEGRSKWGWWSNSTEPGASITLRVPTWTQALVDTYTPVILAFGCTKSGTKPMGTAQLTCLNGCTCEPHQYRARWDSKVSLTSLFAMRVTPHSDCQVHFQVRLCTYRARMQNRSFTVVRHGLAPLSDSTSSGTLRRHNIQSSTVCGRTQAQSCCLASLLCRCWKMRRAGTGLRSAWRLSWTK
jgi:hypothetical protein